MECCETQHYLHMYAYYLCQKTSKRECVGIYHEIILTSDILVNLEMLEEDSDHAKNGWI